jgi:hypothetical protein
LPKKFPEDTWPKIYLGRDPDPVKNRPDPQHWPPPSSNAIENWHLIDEASKARAIRVSKLA